jgi:putative ABC transport system permease protein
MANFQRDIRYALRMLARNPGFSCVAVITLALGIGATTAIFSVVDAVLLKPLPFRSPDQLLMVGQKSASVPRLAISELDLDDYISRTHAFQALGGYTSTGNSVAILTGAGEPTEISPSYITQNYFSLLGITPVLGRDFLPEEGRNGRNRVAILSYGLWQSRFDGSPEIVHRQITLDRQKLQVVGVMGPDAFPKDADVFIPFTREKPLPRNYHELNVVGRLRPGQSEAGAQREMETFAADIARAYPTTNTGIGAYVLPLREEITGKVREPILMLLLAVGLVLLIACGNVANLLLVRAAARQKEIAIRVAVGAGQRRIIGQFAIECLVLSIAGACLGLLLAFGLMPLIRMLGAERIPRLQTVTIDGSVLIFTAAISLFTGLLAGLIPALSYSAANLNQMLRSGGRTSTSESGWLRRVLVAGEVALALVVIVGASLLVRSLNKLLDVQPGFRPDHLLVGRIALPSNHYKQANVQAFYARLLPKIAAIPGVVSVTTSTSVPLASTVAQTRFAVQGMPLPEPGRYPVTAFASVDTEFFKTMGIPILRGRTFRREEVGNLTDERCIINATLQRTFFAAEDPIGRSILTNVAVSPPESCRIVGVAGDTLVEGLDAPPVSMIYFAFQVAKQMLVVRTSTEPMAAASSIRREVEAADPDQPLTGIRTMDQVLSQSLSRRSFAAVLLVLFAAVGLILAALGLYGVMAYSVARRTSEIGVRMALGAQRGSVFGLILRQGLSVTAIGLAVGIVAGVLATRLMSNLLFGIGTADPFSFAVACATLLGVSIVACWIPAHRATRVEPVVALRYE